MFIDAVDFQRHAITKNEFRELIMHMAAADLHSRRSEQQQVPPFPLLLTRFRCPTQAGRMC